MDVKVGYHLFLLVYNNFDCLIDSINFIDENLRVRLKEVLFIYYKTRLNRKKNRYHMSIQKKRLEVKVEMKWRQL